MKITQAGSGLPVSRNRKVTKAGSDDAFRKQIEDSGTSAASGSSGTTPLTALSTLLSIQESPEPTSEKQRAVLHGHSLLDELKELQIDLVEGWVPEDRLRALSHMLDQPRPSFDDPDLNRLLDDIELRAAVELAKLDRRSA